MDRKTRPTHDEWVDLRALLIVLFVGVTALFLIN